MQLTHFNQNDGLIHGKGNIKTFVVRRQEANTTLYTCSQFQKDILNHVLDIIERAILNFRYGPPGHLQSTHFDNGVERIRSSILRALGPDIKLLLQKGLLTFQTLSSLDRKKLEEYNAAGVYLHVILELEQPNVCWLYVGAIMDSKSRVKEHKRLTTVPSRDSLHYRTWNQESRGDFLVLLEGFSNLRVLKQDQVAMNNLLEEFGYLVYQTPPKDVLQRALLEYINSIQPWMISIVYPHYAMVYKFQSDDQKTPRRQLSWLKVHITF